MAGVRLRWRLPSWRWTLPRRWAGCRDTGVPLTSLRGLCLLDASVRRRFQPPAGAGSGAVFALAAPVPAADRLPLAVPEVAVAYSRLEVSSTAAVLNSLVTCTGCWAAMAIAGHSCRKSCRAAVGDALDAEGTLVPAADASTCCLGAQPAEPPMSVAPPCWALPCRLHETSRFYIPGVRHCTERHLSSQI
jgi:hypothetical protein